MDGSYDWLVRRARAEECGERECLGDFTDKGGNRVTCHSVQVHDRAIDGRVFRCRRCGNEDCVDCGIREHGGEMCGALHARLELEHGGEGIETVIAFERGYEGKELTRSGNEKVMLKKPAPCPECGILIEREDKCARMTCEFYGRLFDRSVTGERLMFEQV